MIVRQAACSCGQLTASVEGEPVRVSICHCLSCQRRTGSLFGAQARFPQQRVQLRGRKSTYVRVGDSGGTVTFYFCPDCGATLYYLWAGLLWRAGGGLCRPQLSAAHGLGLRGT